MIKILELLICSIIVVVSIILFAIPMVISWKWKVWQNSMRTILNAVDDYYYNRE